MLTAATVHRILDSMSVPRDHPRTITASRATYPTATRAQSGNVTSDNSSP